MTEIQTDENQNKVSYEHFKAVVELAKECPQDKPGPFPRVAAMIVKDGDIVSQAYRGQVGRGNHAEYIALERKAKGDDRVAGADLITTLEPCTHRSHDKRPCVSWVKSRGIRKVWIGTLDPNPRIAGKGELILQDSGIEIGRFPFDSLTRELREMNKDFFDEIKKKQPQLMKEEQKEEKRLMIDTLREQIKLKQERINSLFEVMMMMPRKESPFTTITDSIPVIDLTGVETEARILGVEIDMLTKALSHALVLDENDVLGWNRLGEILLDGKKFGLSGHAYLTATKIDSSSMDAWVGKARTEISLNHTWDQWPMIRREQYDDDTPQKVKSRAWTKLALGHPEASMKLRIAIRAVQEGAKTQEIKELIITLNETNPVNDPSSWMPRWLVLGRSWEIWGERDMASLCHSRYQIKHHLSQIKALEEGSAPWITLYSLEKTGGLHPNTQNATFKQKLKKRLLEMIAESDNPDEIGWYLNQTKMFSTDKDIENAIVEKHKILDE